MADIVRTGPHPLEGRVIVQNYREWIKRESGELKTLEGFEAYRMVRGRLTEIFHSGALHQGPDLYGNFAIDDRGALADALRRHAVKRVTTVLMDKVPEGEPYLDTLWFGENPFETAPEEGATHACVTGTFVADAQQLAALGLENLERFDPATETFVDRS